MKIFTHVRSLNLLLYLVAFIVLLGTFATMYASMYADRTVKESLLERTQTIAATMDASEVGRLQGSEDDLYTPPYLDLKDKLIALAAIDPDIQFVYLMGKRDQEIFFFADSELADSPDFSPPGQIYEEATPLLQDMFETGESALEGPVTDRWGTWISALSPIVDLRNGEVIAVVGMDISARNYYYTRALYASVPILVTLLLVSGALFIYRIGRKESELISLKSELASIAAHDLRTPLVGINW